MLFTVHRLPFAGITGIQNRAARLFYRIDSLNKPSQHLLNVRGRSLQDFSLFRGKKSQIAGQHGETNQFVSRSRSYVQELPKFGAASPSASLSDVCRDGSCGPSHLAGQAKPLGIGKRGSRAINAHSHPLAFLPHFQFPEVLHPLKPVSPGWRGATVSQCYQQMQVLRHISCLTAGKETPPCYSPRSCSSDGERRNGPGARRAGRLAQSL